jgi:hypothetical protein
MLLGANQYVSKLLAKPEATSRLLKRLDIFKQMPNLFIDDYTFWTNVYENRMLGGAPELSLLCFAAYRVKSHGFTVEG